MPNITVVNELGDFNIAADRLAIIDGEGTCKVEYNQDLELTLHS